MVNGTSVKSKVLALSAIIVVLAVGLMWVVRVKGDKNTLMGQWVPDLPSGIPAPRGSFMTLEPGGESKVLGSTGRWSEIPANSIRIVIRGDSPYWRLIARQGTPTAETVLDLQLTNDGSRLDLVKINGESMTSGRPYESFIRSKGP